MNRIRNVFKLFLPVFCLLAGYKILAAHIAL